jgi:hypothetical protein
MVLVLVLVLFLVLFLVFLFNFFIDVVDCIDDGVQHMLIALLFYYSIIGGCFYVI